MLGLLAYVGITEHGRMLHAFRAIGRGGIAIVVLLALSSASFLVALNHASVANVLFMQALAPVLAAALGRCSATPSPPDVARDGCRARRRRGHGRRAGRRELPRPGLSLLMAVSFAATLVITRHRRDVSMAPATCLSQVLVFAAAARSHPRRQAAKT